MIRIRDTVGGLELTIKRVVDIAMTELKLINDCEVMFSDKLDMLSKFCRSAELNNGKVGLATIGRYENSGKISYCVAIRTDYLQKYTSEIRNGLIIHSLLHELRHCYQYENYTLTMLCNTSKRNELAELDANLFSTLTIEKYDLLPDHMLKTLKEKYVKCTLEESEKRLLSLL